MNAQSTNLTPARRPDIDWIRISATFLLILFGAVKVCFPEATGGVGPRGLSLGAGSILFLASQWYVPLAFLVSGWSRRNSMQHLSARAAFRERFLRLGMPFLTGCLILCPALRYVEFLGGQGIGLDGSGPAVIKAFPEFLLDFFTRQDTFTVYNLWFLFYLFVFSILSWPFFSWLLGRKVTPIKIAPLWVYLPMVPLMLIQLVGDNLCQPCSYEGWAGAASFLTYFIIGFIISRYSAFERVMHHEANRAGALGMVVLIVLMAFPDRLPIELVRAAAAGVSWLVVVFILGVSRRFLDRQSKTLSYLRRATLPVFVLSQAPIVVMGSALMSSTVNSGIKLFFLMAFALGTTFALYHVLIRKVSLLRLLFGMKPEKEHAESWKDQVLHRG